MEKLDCAENTHEIHPSVFKTLSSSGVSYEVVRHSQFNQPIKSPEDFARAAQCQINAVAKSILFRSVGPDALIMLVLPTRSSIDTEAVKRTLGLETLSLVNRKDVEALTSQQMHGISPVGHTGITVLMDESLLGQPSVFVGTGRAGQELKISPEDLKELTNARTGNFSISRGA